jgi:hypothetical protein
LHDVEAERLGEAPDRPRSAHGVEPERARQDGLSAQRAQYDVGVGHGRLLATAAVAGGSRERASAVRTDLEQPVLPDPGDGPAAGPERAHAQHGRADILPGDLALRGLQQAPLDDHADVGRGAAHVEGDDVRPARRARQVDPGDHARRGSRQQRLVGMAGAERYAHQSAVRLHEKELRRPQAALDEPALQPQQIVGDRGTDIGVDHGRRQPRIFADDRQHARRQRDAAVGRDLGEDLARAPLVRGIEEREQEADGDAFDALRLEPARRFAQGRFVERRDHLATIIEALGHLLGQPLRGQQRRLAVERVDEIAAARLRPAPRLVDRTKAARDHQTGACTLAFQQCIGCDRRTVDEERDIAGVEAIREQLVHGIEHGGGGIARDRRHLCATQLAALLLDGDQIGERSSGIDAHQPHGHARLPLRVFL